MKLTNGKYDFLKKVALTYLPALATCIAAIFKIWNLPYGVEISATVMAIDTFLGIILGISTKKYYEDKGDE